MTKKNNIYINLGENVPLFIDTQVSKSVNKDNKEQQISKSVRLYIRIK